jgi:hypothetical protein
MTLEVTSCTFASIERLLDDWAADVLRQKGQKP